MTEHIRRLILRSARRHSPHADSIDELAPTVSEKIIDLQGIVGNQAVQRLISEGRIESPSLTSPSRLASPHIQRDEPTNAPAPPTTWGTAKTTAPVARYSPYSQLLEPLQKEVALYKNANAIITWLKKRIKDPKPADGSAAPALTVDDIVADAATVKLIKPKPASADDLKPTLELLEQHKVIQLVVGTRQLKPVMNDKGDVLNTSAFDAESARISTFTKDFEARRDRPDSVNAVTETDQIPATMAAGTKDEKKRDTDAETSLSDLKKQRAETEASNLDAAAKQEKLAELDVKIAKAEKTLKRAQGYRTFNTLVVDLLKRLNAKNSNWSAGNYAGHSWGEFSADIFLRASLVEVKDAEPYSGQYWNRAAVRQFFDDLNAVAEEDDPETGKFGWHAIYNDIPLAKEINTKYGSGRVHQVENHGPAPDHKLHIHLDLRPITLPSDMATTYKIENGRVKVTP